MAKKRVTGKELEDRIKEIFEDNYQRAKSLAYVQKPYSWALYSTWRVAYSIEKPRCADSIEKPRSKEID